MNKYTKVVLAVIGFYSFSISAIAKDFEGIIKERCQGLESEVLNLYDIQQLAVDGVESKRGKAIIQEYRDALAARNNAYQSAGSEAEKSEAEKRFRRAERARQALENLDSPARYAKLIDAALTQWSTFCK